MGASGSGKSTLLNILGILDDYDSGSYYLAGRLIKDLSETQAAAARNNMIGYIFQSFNLINYKNAVENVALPLYYQGVSRRKRNALALEYLDMLGLKEWAEHMPNEMSGGQKQRVAIARALINKPADHPRRRTHGRTGQRHLAGGDEPAAQRERRHGHDHHLRHPRTVDRRPNGQNHPPDGRRHQQYHRNRTGNAMRELLLEIWTSVRRNKLRTFLTGFSVAWGIFMLVILLGSGNGLKNGVLSNFGNYATNSITISGGWTSKAYAGYNKWRSIDLKNRDLEILVNEFPEVDDVAAKAWYRGSTATYLDRFADISLRGSLPKIQQIEGVEIVKGRFINQADIHNYRKVIVIDEALERILFRGDDPLGKPVKIHNNIYRVAGVYRGDAQQRNSMGYIPLTTGQLIFKANDPVVDNAIITVHGLDTDAQMEAFEQRIRKRLAAEHHYDPEDQSALWIRNTMEQYKSMMIVFGGINLFVWIIGLGTLLAGIVGVSNIMLVTVTERTSEFGIRKALGAKPVSIIRLILTESVMITAMFGYIGMVLGVAVMEAVNYVINQTPAQTGNFGGSIFLNPTLDLGVAVSATVVLVIAGLIAGYVPAYRAAQLKTIDALRYNK